MTPVPTPRKITKRACDGCKIRKVKCSETAPCNGCITVGIPCTFNKKQNTRGPRSLRAKTIQEIAHTQGRDVPNVASPTRLSPPTTGGSAAPGPEMTSPAGSVTSNITTRTPTNALVLQLCVFRLRMFPVWPVIAVEDMLQLLQKGEEDLETYALANMVCAATVVQLKTRCLTDGPQNVTAASMLAECLRVRQMTGEKPGHQPNLNGLRISYFLHVYYENEEAGGVKSLLYLREAITMAHIMRLHQEDNYTSRHPDDQQLRRRLLWLLYTTERGVAMLHKLPPILSSNVLFPFEDKDDDVSILPAFRKLANLFYMLDQSGAFYIILNVETDIFEDANEECLARLQNNLMNFHPDGPSVTDVQRVDLCVTRQWIRIVLWRVSKNTGTFPIQVGKEFVDGISQLPDSAVESHGPAIELKMYEIAISVANAISQCQADGIDIFATTDNPFAVLNGIYGILSKCRGGNADLLSRLREKISVVKRTSSSLPPISNDGAGTSVQWPIGNLFDPIYPPITHQAQPSLTWQHVDPDVIQSIRGSIPKLGGWSHHQMLPGLSQTSGGTMLAGLYDEHHHFGSNTLSPIDASSLLDRMLSNNQLGQEQMAHAWPAIGSSNVPNT